jgi:hypothetical protein
MTKQHQSLLNLKSIVRATLIALGLAILFGKLDAPAAQLSNLLGLAAKATLELLPSLAFAFDDQWLSPCPVQMLVSSWPLLHAVVAAV